MLGRRQIREKVLQAVYAYNVGGNSIETVEKNLFQSIREIYDLYVYQLNLLIAVKNYAANLIDVKKSKRYATEDEQNPNTKFVDNVIFKLLEDNIVRQEHTESHKELLWTLNENYVAMVFKKIESSLQYFSYMQNPEHSFDEDKRLIQGIFVKYIAENEILHEWFEELKLGWADDMHIANNMTLKTLKSIYMDSKFDTLIQIFKSQDDIDFTTKLFRKTTEHYPLFLNTIQERSKNWKLDRIAEIDKIILSMGFCEMEFFPENPTKVIINECIELAKAFSTNNSNIFVNGILDRYAKETGKI